MQIYTFCSEKNFKLINERNIRFEEIIADIDEGLIVNIVEHPNKKKYGEQKIYVVSIKEYVYLVPFVLDVQGNIFLKTIILSRKAKKNILKKDYEKNKKKDPQHIDEEEAILSSFEKDEWKSVKDLTKEKCLARQTARQTLRKDVRINIRLATSDVLMIKQKAAYEGCRPNAYCKHLA